MYSAATAYVIEEQMEQDAAHRVARDTGVFWDRITNDYALWIDGRIRGWCKSRHEARLRLSQEAGR